MFMIKDNKGYSWIVLLLLLIACKKDNKVNLTSYTYIGSDSIHYDLMKDKTILHTQVDSHFYHFTFIEKDTSSQFYEVMAKFDLPYYDYTGSYKNYLDTLKKGVTYSEKIHPFIGDWVGVYKFREDYVLYLPEDWGTIEKTVFTRSVATDFMMDGIMPVLITKTTQTDEQTLFDLRTPAQVFARQKYNAQRKVVYWDKQRRLIKVSHINDDEMVDTRYYIPKDSIYQYPLIVEYTNNPFFAERFNLETVE